MLNKSFFLPINTILHNQRLGEDFLTRGPAQVWYWWLGAWRLLVKSYHKMLNLRHKKGRKRLDPRTPT